MFWRIQIKEKYGTLLLIIFFFCLISFFGLIAKEALAAQSAVRIGDFEGKPDSVIEIPVVIENIAGIAGAQFDFKYDPAVATATKVEKGDLVKDFLLVSNLDDAKNGKISIALAGSAGVAGNGTLVMITLKLGDKEGETDLELKNVEINDENGKLLTIMATHGKINIANAVQLPPKKDEEVKETEKVNEPEKKPEKEEPEKKEQPKEEKIEEFFITKAIDVPIVHWASEYIEKLLLQDIICGYPDKTFRPENPVSRAEFAKILVKGLKLEPPEKAETIFTDVVPQDWFFGSVEAAARANLVKGANGKFLPNDPVTRQEMAVILMRALGKEEKVMEKAKETLSFQDDGEIAPWAKGHIALAVEEGLLRGYPDNNLAPNKNATRAEACAIIYNLIKAKNCKP